jgi:superoxide dismutase, Cu-Zn family
MKTAFGRLLAASAFAALLTGAAHAADSVTMHLISADGLGDEIGTVTLEDAPGGLLFTPNLHGLTPGEHGFHVHQNPLM